MGGGPLDGLRVVDLTDDSGRFATKLLAECGASVARLGRGTPGPPMRAEEAAARGGLLDWWYDAGKQRLDVDLDTEEGRSAYRQLAQQADLVVETEPPGRLAALGIDHADLVGANPRLVQVSLTPFGRTGPRASWQTTDLVSAALGGVLSVSGTADQPVNPWGRQSFNVGGFLSAISALAAVRSARRTGRGQHVDVSLHETVCTTIEQLFFQYWFDDILPYPKVAARQGSLHWIGAYEVVPARDGWVMITPTPNAAGMLGWMVEEGFPEALELAGRPLGELITQVPLIMKTIASFAREKDPTEVARAAQDRHIAFGEVLSVARVAGNPQHAFRQFFRPVEGDGVEGDGSGVRLAGPIARFHGSPAPAARPPGTAADPAGVLDRWSRARSRPITGGSDGSGGSGPRPAKPLDGIRVLDLSHVLAGPMCTRVLGDLGADVIKMQTTERAVIVNDPSHPYFYVWNRSKRGVALNMKDPRAPEVMRRLIEQSDVLIENFSAGVLDRWGLSYEQVRSWNPALVYVTMSGSGHQGPWSDLVTYAPTIHALAGITYLSNPPGRGDIGPGFSLNDHAAGLSAAFSVLAALSDREVTGSGQHVDISQMETGGYLIGPALTDFLDNGREAAPVGNHDPFGGLCPNDCYPTADTGWLAVSCRDDGDWRRMTDACGIKADAALDRMAGRLAREAEVDSLVSRWASTVTAESGQELLQGAGVPAGRVQYAADLMTDPQHTARGLWREFDHAVFGVRPHDRFPALWSDTTLEPYRPAPAYVGEHNFEVYAELLGLDETAVAEGMGDGLFG